MNDGIFWIEALIIQNDGNNLEVNTTYYVKRLIRKFVYLNRSRVKREVKIKRCGINILDFLVENGSVNAYLLREDII